MLLLLLCLASFCWSARGSGGHPKFPRAPQPSCSRGIPWGGPGRTARVVGGEVPPSGAVPWQIELRNGDGGHHCGGVLIGRRLVLSAAHCYDEGLRAVAAAGSPSNEQILKIERFIPHPDFSKLGPYSHDLSFLLVSEPGFDTSELVRPACLPEEDPTPGAWCEVSGWGADDPNNIDQASSVLRTAAVSVISMETCRNRTVYGGGEQQILDSMMCAGRLGGGVDSCRGDSGGPLMCERGDRFELVGIVSWGEGCAQKGKPGVYTRVSSFLHWIKKNMRESGEEFEV